MTDIRTILRQATDALGDRLEAEFLLAHALGVSRAWFFAHADDPAEAAATERFESLVRRRVAGEPIAYITGTRDFWSLTLEVTPATLIPRAETELLVELALERLPEGGRVADLGTGSGAIALAMAKERPDALVFAVDASADALAVARRNARRLGLERVVFAHGDWLVPLGGEAFDLIVGNPPYIESADHHLREGDLRFEPLTALASGTDGLDDIRRIATASPARLAPGGWLLLEHGWNQGAAVREVLERAGFLNTFTAQDLERRDRVSGGCKPA
ncbi:MAG TPA: peptide chain release factor N(5)-glutamine methyltransferase [Luteibacter sp.]|uniref:peptide chain release factor N(5)-glutamine methyltransferase n=1 Tax=Luteibacter sp. TaxID=1886636 RepID=UPI002C23745D|nr:peptide chain release factor N(5)-glutamine methyltransferase [Luteibacter sp.]HVI55041.1 peptide chain release factor N(5)-glutamine methyltransferase [Luteibacter sp.]